MNEEEIAKELIDQHEKTINYESGDYEGDLDALRINIIKQLKLIRPLSVESNKRQ